MALSSLTTQDYVPIIGLTAQTVLFLLGGYAMIVRNDAKRQAHAEVVQQTIGDMRAELKKLTEVIITQAVQTQRIDNLYENLTLINRTVEDLRRGNGFVKGRTGLDGEYP